MAVVASELLKLRTTRTFFGVTLLPLLIVGIIAVAASAGGSFEHTQHPGRDLFGVAGIAQLFALVLGVLAVTTEFRHGTITPTLLVVPSRARLVAAKLVVQLLAGLLLGAAAFALCVAIVQGVLSSRGIETGVDAGGAWHVILGGAIGTALYAAVGLGVGAIVRNQVAGIVIVLGWTFVVEPLLGIVPGLQDGVQEYGLGGAAAALARTATSSPRLDQLPAGLLLAGYAAVLTIIGIAALRRRDISA
jgi:ABC-2 type transport system permease protein